MSCRCASCGRSVDVAGSPGFSMAYHLRSCRERDTGRFVPRWKGSRDAGFECAWTTIDVDGWEKFPPHPAAIALEVPYTSAEMIRA